MSDNSTAFGEPIYVTRPSLPDLGEYRDLLKEIWETNHVTNSGPVHQQFELEVSRHLKVPYATAVVNGHSALEAAIRALQLTGEVITTPFTFPSTVHAIQLNGLTPIFCDISPDGFGVDTSKIEQLITAKTSAILAVHVYGYPCNVFELEEIAHKHGLKVIYDAAHAFGVELDGRGIGEFGDLSAFSLHATKVFSTVEGGLVTHTSPEHAENLSKLRNFGYPVASGDDDIEVVGSNMKMSELHAAVGLLNLGTIQEQIKKRSQRFELYLDRISKIRGLELAASAATKPNFAYCPVLVDRVEFGHSRDQLSQFLNQHNVFPRRYFYPLCSELSCYKHLSGNQPPTVVARKIASDVLCLPIYPDLPLRDVEKICDIIGGINKK